MRKHVNKAIGWGSAMLLFLAVVLHAATWVPGGYDLGYLALRGTPVTSTAAELNIMDGVTSTAAELNILDGCTATVAELNILDNAPASISFAAAAGGANVCEVTITVLDAAGAAITSPACFVMEWWLSDAATGVGLTGTSASGTVAAKSGEGTDLVVHSAKKYTKVFTKASVGTYVLEITDTSKTAFYVCAQIDGKAYISTVLATGDYGT